MNHAPPVYFCRSSGKVTGLLKRYGFVKTNICCMVVENFKKFKNKNKNKMRMKMRKSA
jgi:hypothetical protein